MVSMMNRKDVMNMKTAEQILDEIAPFAQIEMHHTDYEKIIQAMKIYAEQAVDECAEVATISESEINL